MTRNKYVHSRVIVWSLNKALIEDSGYGFDINLEIMEMAGQHHY